MSRGPNLLASYFTLAGDVDPFCGAPVSPYSLRTRIEAAGRAGFRGFGFGIEDLEHSLRTTSYAEIVLLLEDNGIIWSELELLRNWFIADKARRVNAGDRRLLLQAAERISPAHIKVGSSGPDQCDEAIAECFAELCDQAAQVGTSVVLEISPIGRVCDVARGRRIIELAEVRNGGLALDLWHVSRGGINLADIAELPPGIVRFAELCDGTMNSSSSYIDDTVNRRLLCGTGEFEIAKFVSALHTAGYHGPLGVEVLSQELRRLSPHCAAKAVYDSATAAIHAVALHSTAYDGQAS